MKADVYQRITVRIVEQLERGTVPWRKTRIGGDAGHPRNLVSDHRYRGINLVLLAFAPYESPLWLTYKQAQRLGGNVQKGEEATPVVFWKWLEKENPETGR